MNAMDSIFAKPESLTPEERDARDARTNAFLASEALFPSSWIASPVPFVAPWPRKPI